MKDLIFAATISALLLLTVYLYFRKVDAEEAAWSATQRAIQVETYANAKWRGKP